MKRTQQYIICLIMVWVVSATAHAGSAPADGSHFFDPETVIGFAKKVEKSLAENGARVAILARVGRTRENLPDGIRFTHVAFAVYSRIQTADGRTIPGYAVHNLYQLSDKREKSRLVQDFPVDFFAGVQVLEAGIIIPTPEVQKRLLQVLTSPVYHNLHNPNYSVIANPYTLEFQNCTEHTLDVLFSAIYETDNPEQIKANQKAYFKAQQVRSSPFKMLLGSMFVSDVALSDHPGKIETATFTTIGDFLEQYNMTFKRYVVIQTASL
jgi:hypothetical protein